MFIKNVMTNKQGSMPGGMAESLTTGDSHVPVRRAIGSIEVTQLVTKAARWGVTDKPSDARTRAQSKDKTTVQQRKRTNFGPTTRDQRGISRTNLSEGQSSPVIEGNNDTGRGLDQPVAGGD